jgi:hypothetical protein
MWRFLRNLLLILAFGLKLGIAAEAETAQTSTAASPENRWQVVFNSEFRYLSWQSSGGNPGIVPGIGSGGGNGSLIYLPAALQLTGRPSNDVKLEFLVRSGENWTRQSSTTGTITFSSPTDTTVSATASYFGWAGVQPFLTLNVNIPTGRTIINNKSSDTNMDSNLIPTPVFGEGWNFGPTIGFNIPINESVIISLGAGYTNRGSYDRFGAFDPVTSMQGQVSYDPGDVYTLNGSIGYRGDRGSIQFSAAYSIETASLVNGQQWYEPGGRIVLTGIGGYAWSDTWSSRVTGAYAHMGKYRIAVGGSGLVEERANSNGDIYRITADTTYNKGNLSIGPTGSFLYRASNAYESTAPEYVPDRSGWSAGVIATYRVNQQITFNTRVEHMWVREADNPDNVNAAGFVLPGTGIPASITNGWLATLGAAVHF